MAHIVVGALCAFGAMVCLILASISVPVTNVVRVLPRLSLAHLGSSSTSRRAPAAAERSSSAVRHSFAHSPLTCADWGACAYQGGVKSCTAQKVRPPAPEPH